MTDETALRDRLADLAGEAGEVPGDAVDPAGLWSAGVRRQRRRRAAYAGGGLAAALVLVAGVALGGQLVGESREPGPAVPPASELHLPDRILQPDPWSEGTAEAGEIGPLAMISESKRTYTRGWFDEVDGFQIYGVSAVDGTARFLDLPVDEEAGEGQPYTDYSTALSPDGRWVAYEVRLEDVESDGAGSRLTGYRLYDTVTGETADLTDPERPQFWSSGDYIRFTADSRYLLTSYVFDGPATSENGNALVAWEVETGERTVLKEPDPDALWHVIGTAPRGLLLADGFEVRHVDPASGEVDRFSLPKAVVDPSIGPDGKAFAYVGDPMPGKTGGITSNRWRLYAGPDRDHLRKIALPGRGKYVGAVLGWRDVRHVIVGDWHDDFAEVDVVTGEVRTFQIPGAHGGPSTKANDLWANDLVPAVEPPDAGDPRTPWKVAIGIGVGLGVVGLVVLRRRRRRAR